VRNQASSVLEVDKWIMSDFILSKLVPSVGIRPFPLDEQMLMVATVCTFKPELIFDWGTHIGKSARVFWETCQAFNIVSQIHSIDLPSDIEHQEHPGRSRGHLVRNRKNVFLHQGDGVLTALKLCDQLGDKNKRYLFYVDGDHSYQSVKRELSLILERVNNPIILLHDTFLQDEKSGYNIGPHLAVDDCLKNYGKINRIQTNLGLPGMTLLH
jgi:cephalosporin hydroxylase